MRPRRAYFTSTDREFATYLVKPSQAGHVCFAGLLGTWLHVGRQNLPRTEGGVQINVLARVEDRGGR